MRAHTHSHTIVLFLRKLYGMGQTPYNNWPCNVVWLPWCTMNKSFPSLRLMLKYIHMTTLFALTRVKYGVVDSVCIRLPCVFSILFHYRKIFSNKRMHSNRVSIPLPHIINLFSGQTIYFCALPIYFTLLSGSFRFCSPSYFILSVFIFQVNPIENCTIASFQFVSNHHCTLVWSSAKRKWLKEI